MESKHFGFTTFENAICVLDALASRPHKVGGRAIDARRAIPKKNDSETALVRTKRLFVGGVASNATEHDIASYINETYNGLGHVVTCDLKRGFAFLEVSSKDFADLILISRAVLHSNHVLNTST
eukprot:gene16475-18112_t